MVKVLYKVLNLCSSPTITLTSQWVVAGIRKDIWPKLLLCHCHHTCIATDPHMPRRSCVWCCRTTSAEHFADQPPSASPLPWTVPTGAKSAFIWLCLQGLVTFYF